MNKRRDDGNETEAAFFVRFDTFRAACKARDAARRDAWKAEQEAEAACSLADRWRRKAEAAEKRNDEFREIVGTFEDREQTDQETIAALAHRLADAEDAGKSASAEIIRLRREVEAARRDAEAEQRAHEETAAACLRSESEAEDAADRIAALRREAEAARRDADEAHAFRRDAQLAARVNGEHARTLARHVAGIEEADTEVLAVLISAWTGPGR